MLSFTEENYIKALVRMTFLTEGRSEVGVNELSDQLDVKPATVSDMVKKLKVKKLVNYERYGKVSLTPLGKKLAMLVIRRHRLWETFLFSKLDFSWGEVHDLAEELEHIHSEKLMDKLDEFLGFPEFDPHGEAIPNRYGEILIPFRLTLSDVVLNKKYRVKAVKDATEVLKYLDRIQLTIDDEVEVIHQEEFDQLTTIRHNEKSSVVSEKLLQNIFVVCADCGKAKCEC